MFTTRCPRFLGETGVFHNKYESNNIVDGDWIDDQEAFCGKGFVKNPKYLYNNVNGLYLGSAVNTVSIWMFFVVCVCQIVFL